MKTPRGTSESSTTSDNTAEFIDIVKKYDVVYNTHNQDYKNVDIKMKVWSQIAEEIGLSVDASKRKWKNLRDSYTKYLRSFRIGTKTSKKYQYWAHAEHMDFLKPYQGPGRNSNNAKGIDNDDDAECDFGYQVLTKASEEDLKSALTVNVNNTNLSLIDVGTPSAISATNSTSIVNTVPNNALVPSLPTVPLPPPPLSCKPVLTPISSATLSNAVQSTHIFPLPSLMSTSKNAVIPIPTTSTASSVGCLIIEPITTSDNLKKELTLPSLGVLHSITSSTVTSHNRSNPPLVTKIRRVQPSTKPTANVVISSNSAQTSSSAAPTTGNHPPPPKSRKIPDNRWPDIDINTVLQAARELDSNTLFFLSLARSVRTMPTKYQSLAKMRCMRVVSDIELELDNASADVLLSDTSQTAVGEPNAAGDLGTEHFVYVMSPSRVESMIDISSDEDAGQNGN